MPIAFAPYRFAMRTVPTFVVAAIALLALSGCQPDTVPIIPDPVPTSDLLFDSEEEALAAAEEAYGAYLAVLDTIFAEGGERPERLRDVATEEVLSEQLSGFESYASEGKRSVGETLFDSMVLQSADLSRFEVTDVVVVYVCQDFSAIDVLGPDGSSVVSQSRQTRWPLTVTFDATDGSPRPLVVSSTEDWTGADFCVDSSQ